ncbi:MAG TPA: rRNA adenine N-6-methyltransferase family protein, partial [Spirochaetota bacterium]|nr:rRNA adenine N-6-methyltransferase family protein [Spirochaetota bacterium]
MNTKTITSILAEHGIQVNKKLGQNFLCNDDVVEKILTSSGVTGVDRVLEIGPGLGALTERMAERAAHVTAGEIDAGLARYLQHR